MHELGIAQEILNIAGQYIPQNSNHVKSVTVKIGKLSNVFVDSLQFGYEVLSESTPFQNSELIVEEIPVTIKCNSCASTQVINGLEYLCKNCGSPDIKVISGNELQLVEIEVDD